MEKFVLNPDEKLLINDPYAMWMKTEMMAIQGSLKLTDKRLVFVKNANPFAGLLQLFMKSQRSCVLQDFSLGTIKNYSRKKFFKNERLKEYVTSKIESFLAELKNAGIKIKE